MGDIVCDGVHTWLPSGTQHNNLLELQAVFLVFQHFSPMIWGRYVKVRYVTAYISRRGRVCSAASLKLAENLWCWASKHLSSLRALHVLGLENRGANLRSRGGPLLDKWRLLTP